MACLGARASRPHAGRRPAFPEPLEVGREILIRALGGLEAVLDHRLPLAHLGWPEARMAAWPLVLKAAKRTARKIGAVWTCG